MYGMSGSLRMGKWSEGVIKGKGGEVRELR
jgi:hypothetical protein